jgi:hypothetical protein
VTDTSDSRLSRLQRDIIGVLAERGSDYFLTGGAVLAGWVLCHRPTDDLDVFTEHDAAIEAADRFARYIANETRCTVEAVQSAPDFRRYLLSREGESVQVDFVRDRAPQLFPKVVRDGVRTDSVEEIVANKLCALTGRSEIRDLVDLMFLERAGYRAESFIEPAAQKDGGATPATIAWVLSNLRIPDELPGDASREEVADFAHDLERRMRDAARPHES